MAKKLWKKGDPSPNPSGRPKENVEFLARCKSAVDKYVIDAWLVEVEHFGPNWMKASELLAAYGYGKPTQRLEHTGADGKPIETIQKKDPDEISNDELSRIIKEGK